jgi:hypothetical protein
MRNNISPPHTIPKPQNLSHPELVVCHPELVVCHPELVEGRLRVSVTARLGTYAPTASNLPPAQGNTMTLLVHVVIVLIVVGVLLWLINRYLPMASAIKSILNFVVVIAVIFWLLQAFGIWDYTSLHIHG